MKNNTIELNDVFLKTPGDTLWKCVLAVGQRATLTRKHADETIIVSNPINAAFNEQYKHVWSEDQPGIVQASKGTKSLNPFEINLNSVIELEIDGTADNPRARLVGVVEILGVKFHVNLEEVHDIVSPTQQMGSEPPITGSVTTQATTIPEEETFAAEIWELIQGAGKTVKVDGRNYLMVIFPFQQ